MGRNYASFLRTRWASTTTARLLTPKITHDGASGVLGTLVEELDVAALLTRAEAGWRQWHLRN